MLIVEKCVRVWDRPGSMMLDEAPMTSRYRGKLAKQLQTSSSREKVSR
jgi:hypothetical protein